NCLRRAEKNSAPSPCKFEFTNSVISTNSSSGSFNGATLLKAFKYSRSALLPFRGRIVTAAKDKSSSNDEQQEAQQYHHSQKSTAFHKRGCLFSCGDAGKYVNQAPFCTLAINRRPSGTMQLGLY